MKRNPVRIIVVLIIIGLCFSWFIIDFLEKSAVYPQIDNPYQWKFDKNNSEYGESWFSAKFNITNLKNNPTIDLIIPTISGDIDFNEISIGEISFKDPKSPKNYCEQQTVKKVEIDSGDIQTVDFYMGIFNGWIPACWNDYIENDEIGRLKGRFTLRFEVGGTEISIPLKVKINETLNISLLEQLQDIEKNYSINYTINNFVIKKDKGNNEIFINLTFLKREINIIKLTLGEVDWEENHISEFQTRIKQSLEISTFRWLYRFIPVSWQICANDWQIGKIILGEQKVNNKFEWSIGHETREFCPKVIFYNTIIDDLFYSHLMNNGSTQLEICPTNYSFVTLPFWVNISIEKLLANLEFDAEEDEEKYLPDYLEEFRVGILISAILLVGIIIADYIRMRKLE